ncbi:MAG: hypothetical protein ACYCSA_07615 [Thermoplasmataceae archaeon]
MNGKKYCLWAFRSAEKDVLVVIKDPRGRKVVRETLEEDFYSPVIVDWWRAYSHITVIQRCWTYLIREVDAHQHSYH